MPDTLSRDQLAAIRWQDEQDYERLEKGAFYHTTHVQRHALLAHIDAMTEAVPELVAVAIANLPNGGGVTYYEALGAGHRVAAILRGEQ